MNEHVQMSVSHFAWIPDGPLQLLQVSCSPIGQLVWLYQPSEEVAAAALWGAVKRYLHESGGAYNYPPLEIRATPRQT